MLYYSRDFSNGDSKRLVFLEISFVTKSVGIGNTINMENTICIIHQDNLRGEMT